MALAYYNLKNYEMAIENFNKSIDINSGNIDSYNGIGLSYYYLGEKEKALIYLNKVLDIDPSYNNAYETLFNIYFDLEEYDNALYLADKILKLKPNSFKHYDKLITICFNNSKYDKVIEYSHKIQNKSADVYNMLAVSYYHLKDYDNACLYYNKLIEMDKSSFYLYNNLAIIYYLKKDYYLLLNTYSRYIDNFDLNNDNFASYNVFLLSYTLLKKNIISYDDFLSLFEKSLNKSIEHYNIHNKYDGRSLYKYMTYDTNSLKLIFESKIESNNLYDMLTNLMEHNKLKSIKTIIDKIKISSFSLYNNSILDNNTLCIEYQSSSDNTVVLDSKYYN